MKKLIVILFFLPFTLWAQQDSIASGGYNWQQPVMQNNKLATTILAQGKVHDFDWMLLNANTIYGTKAIQLRVAANEEEVIIIKSGAIRIHFRDSTFLLTANSIAVMLPGQKFSLQNAMNEHADFYTMRYSNKNSGEIKKSVVNRSFVKLFQDAPFMANNIGGGKRDFFECNTTLQKRFEVHLSTLKEGTRSHEPHTHKAEEIVLMIDGDTEMQIGDEIKKVNAGGFYFLGSNVLHAITNIGTKPCTYFAIQFE